MWKESCPVCQGADYYPMIVSHEPRAICAHEIHQKYIHKFLTPTLWMRLSRGFQYEVVELWKKVKKMASIGHGISDAVRNHIPIWVDDPLVEVLYTEYKKAGGELTALGFRGRIRSASDWVRKSRKTTSSGYERLYHCKTVAKAKLIVHSPETDMSADSYVFCVEGEDGKPKPVAGGKTKLKSTHVSQAVSKTDKTSVRPQDVVFVKFTADELQRMRVQMEYGDGLDYFEMERDA